ncbi:hypothetical protein QJS10_CPB11g00425 [Acorus calamus]|uniref:Pectinesterase inhibitor domain-containing protein n=1 Tax=Acorus calamus TaxID=4465 RepID=A0AAV9DVI9_ACOCL|nr:hypothetical protein QJS10_CPB11g00425 [Acorus calamus]
MDSRHALAILLTLLLFSARACARAHHRHIKQNSTNFIRTSCSATLYPQVCYKTLSAYASTIRVSPLQLAQTALNVSLSCARTTLDVVSNLSKAAEAAAVAPAMSDCVENVGDSADQLRQSLEEMRGLVGPEFGERIGNIQTWVSAALTNEDTCADALRGGAGEGSGGGGSDAAAEEARRQVESLGQLTSNALALVNRLTSD